jgi:salicylate hydroxylase
MIRIAIIGGGLAGATLMNALRKHSNLQADIFESAPEFSERGAAVGLAQNAQNALAKTSDDMEAAVHRAGAVKMHSSRLVVVCLPFNRGSRYLRQTFLDRLLIVYRRPILELALL